MVALKRLNAKKWRCGMWLQSIGAGPEPWESRLAQE